MGEKIELVIFPVVNYLGRKHVEKGKYCVRKNENGVDLNRNWNDHWQKNDPKKDSEVYSGPKPFSEPETRLLMEFATSFRPHLFMTTHSGALTMMLPYAYKKKLAPGNKKLLQVISRLHKKHCPHCLVGSAAETISYLSPGTCLDYVFDYLGTPYSVAVEMYANDHRSYRKRLHKISPYIFPKYYSKKSSLRLSTNKKKKIRISRNRQKISKLFPIGDRTNMQIVCLETFNPVTKEGYIQTIEQWNIMYRDLLLSTLKLKNKEE